MPHGSATSGGGYEEVAAARRGRFRVTSSTKPEGAPEATLGRFRLMPTSNYGAISPILQRGRFAVIPEEPHGSPSSQGVPTVRSPSPEWDFDIEHPPVKTPTFRAEGFDYFCRIILPRTVASTCD